MLNCIREVFSTLRVFSYYRWVPMKRFSGFLIIVKYVLIGALIGLFFALFGTILQVYLSREALNIRSILAAQSRQPLLWIIDTFPLFLALACGFYGAREGNLMQLNTWLEQTVAERTVVLNQTNDALLHEVEERRQTDELVSQAKKDLETTFDAVTDPIILTNDEDRIIRCNKALSTQLGKSYQEIIGQPFIKTLFNSDESAPSWNRQSGVVTFPSLSGTYDVSIYPIEIGGMMARTLYILRDITASKNAETEVLRQKQYFEALVRNSPAAIVVLDNKGKIQSCNPAFEQLYGYTAKEVFGRDIDQLITTPDTIEEAIAFTEKAHTGLARGNFKRLRKDGSPVDVEVFGVPVVVEGERLGVLGIYHDITDLVSARYAAEEANRAKSEFLANMSHEIRTPMNGIIGMLELALDTTLTSEQRDYLNTSLQSAESLLALLNDILDFSKIEAGRLDLEAIDFDLRTTVEDVAYTLAKRAHDKGLKMACLVNRTIHPDLRGDPGRLRQILVNLVGNAIKFTDEGEIILRADPVTDTPTHGKVRFSVHDTGVGIPRERQNAIFERFTQADGSTTRRYGGTGLGLSITKQLVEAMGGKISVESEPGKGSTFSFELLFEKRPIEIIKEVSAPVDFHNLKVLCIDDNATSRMILTKTLAGLGCWVSVATSGVEGLEMLRVAARANKPFKLILLDMHMPEMDGEQTARAIKSEPAGQDVKIIVLTSLGERGDVKRLEDLGCSAYLHKPVKQKVLADAIVAVFSSKPRKGTTDRLVTRHTLAEQKHHGMRLLLAEDNAINRKLVTTLLGRTGFTVDAVENGQQVLEKLKTEEYNAILMDVQMPVMDGFETTHRIRELETEKGGHIPIIAMTAHAMKGDRERCIETGMDDYLSKPLQPQALFTVIDRWVQYAAKEVLGMAGSSQETGDSKETNTTHPEQESRGREKASNLPMDIEAALPRFNNDRAFLAEMSQEFIHHLTTRVAFMRSTLQANDVPGLNRHAHSLKGMSANFSANPLATLADKLEYQLGKGNGGTVTPLVNQIASESSKLIEYIRENLLKEE